MTSQERIQKAKEIVRQQGGIPVRPSPASSRVERAKQIVQQNQTSPVQSKPVEQPGYLGMSRNNYLDPNKIFGIGKGIGQSFGKLGNIISKPLDKLYEKVTGKKPAIPASLTDEQLRPKSGAEKLGKLAGDVTQYALGAEATKPLISSIQAKTALTKLPGLSKGLINTFGRGVVSAGEAAGITKLQGGNKEDTETAVLLGFAAPFVGQALGGVKKVLGKAGGKIQYSVIKPSKKDLENGFKIQNVLKHNVGGSLDEVAAKTQSKLETLTSELKSKIPRGSAQVDLNELGYKVIQKFDKPSIKTAGMNKAMKTALDDFLEEVSLLSKEGKIDIADAQDVKRAFGAKGAWQWNIPRQDAEATERVYTYAYNVLKEEIEKKGLPGIRELNRAISELIPIEQAVIRRIPVDARNNAFSLGDLVALTREKGGTILYLLNRLAKSGKVGNTLMKAGKTPVTRSGVGTSLFGAGTKDVEKAAPFELNVGLSVKDVSKAVPQKLERFKVNPKKAVRINRYTPSDAGALRYPSYVVPKKNN